VMMLSTPSSVKPVPENMYQDAYSSISNQLLLMRSELVPTDNSSILNNLFQVKKMLLTTSLEVTIPSVKKSSISASTESENLLINVLVSKVSLSSTPSVVELDLDSDPSSSRDSPSIMVKNLN